MLTDDDLAIALAEARNLLYMMATDRRAAATRIGRGLGALRAHLLFRGAELGHRVNTTGWVRVVADGRSSIGDHVQFSGGMIPSQIVSRSGGELVIGAHSGFNYGVDIDCTQSIRIGQRCLFGSTVCLCDSEMGRTGPIVIEDNVWIAHGAIGEPGVRIGAGSVVSAGSVVTTDVPPDSLALGNPAESFPLGRNVRNDPVSAQRRDAYVHEAVGNGALHQ